MCPFHSIIHCIHCPVGAGGRLPLVGCNSCVRCLLRIHTALVPHPTYACHTLPPDPLPPPFTAQPLPSVYTRRTRCRHGDLHSEQTSMFLAHFSNTAVYLVPFASLSLPHLPYLPFVPCSLILHDYSNLDPLTYAVATNTEFARSCLPLCRPPTCSPASPCNLVRTHYARCRAPPHYTTPPHRTRLRATHFVRHAALWFVLLRRHRWLLS